MGRLEAHYAGAIPVDLLKSEQARISGELDRNEQRLSAVDIKFETVEKNLTKALDLAGSLHGAYLAADSNTRRLMNQAMFERILVDDAAEASGALNRPFDLLVEGAAPSGSQPLEKTQGPETRPWGLNVDRMVELGGLEPPTSWVRSRRSPN